LGTYQFSFSAVTGSDGGSMEPKLPSIVYVYKNGDLAMAIVEESKVLAALANESQNR
jgi:hypothetical protein